MKKEIILFLTLLMTCFAVSASGQRVPEGHPESKPNQRD
jgi:hypothetical protein